MFRHFGLTIVLIALFLVFLLGQSVAGWRVYNNGQEEFGRPQISLVEYFGTGHWLGATAENWESEFLQLMMFVALTACLFQKGSPESHDPDADETPPPVTEKSPWPARRGGWIKSLYGRSLSIAFGLLFLASFALHAAGASKEYNREQSAKGEETVSVVQYLGTSQFWFESFQNWQSEFLSIAAMVVFAIFLRQEGSPESKHVATPTWEHDE